ncbi:hypothetical protein L9F63_018810, partial [Diploptera punctata]
CTLKQPLRMPDAVSDKTLGIFNPQDHSQQPRNLQDQNESCLKKQRETISQAEFCVYVYSLSLMIYYLYFKYLFNFFILPMECCLQQHKRWTRSWIPPRYFLPPLAISATAGSDGDTHVYHVTVLRNLCSHAAPQLDRGLIFLKEKYVLLSGNGFADPEPTTLMPRIHVFYVRR